MSDFLLRGFKPPREAIDFALGKLEREVMEALWRQGEATVRDVLGVLRQRPAYTTVMTTLDRLYRKKLLDRRKESRAFVYSPRLSREEFERGVARDVVDGLLAREVGSAEPVLTCIVEAVSEHDHGLLDELERLVREKKREMGHTD